MDRVLLPRECSPDAFLDKVTPKRKRRADKAAAEAAAVAAAGAITAEAPAPAPTPIGKTPSFSSFSSFSSGSGSSSVRSNTSVCGFQIPKKRPRSDTVSVVVVRSRRDDD